MLASESCAGLQGRRGSTTPLVRRDTPLRALREALSQALNINAEASERLLELRRDDARLTEQTIQQMAEAVAFTRVGRVVATDPDCVGEGLFAKERQPEVIADEGKVPAPVDLFQAQLDLRLARK